MWCVYGRAVCVVCACVDILCALCCLCVYMHVCVVCCPCIVRGVLSVYVVHVCVPVGLPRPMTYVTVSNTLR